MRYLLLPLLFLQVCISSFGQANVKSDNIEWNIDSFMDMKDTTSHAMASKFVSYANNKIVWIQKNGTYLLEYPITSTNGTWPDASNDGEILFKVSFQSMNGSFSFSKVNGMYEIKMVFPDENGKNTMPYIFHIANYTKL